MKIKRDGFMPAYFFNTVDGRSHTIYRWDESEPKISI